MTSRSFNLPEGWTQDRIDDELDRQASERRQSVIRSLARDMKQIAQQVHQAYHNPPGGNWRDCPMSTCERARLCLQEHGLFD